MSRRQIMYCVSNVMIRIPLYIFFHAKLLIQEAFLYKYLESDISEFNKNII